MSPRVSALILVAILIGGVLFGRLVLDKTWSAALLIVGAPVGAGLFVTFMRSRRQRERD